MISLVVQRSTLMLTRHCRLRLRERSLVSCQPCTLGTSICSAWFSLNTKFVQRAPPTLAGMLPMPRAIGCRSDMHLSSPTAAPAMGVNRCAVRNEALRLKCCFGQLIQSCRQSRAHDRLRRPSLGAPSVRARVRHDRDRLRHHSSSCAAQRCSRRGRRAMCPASKAVCAHTRTGSRLASHNICDPETSSVAWLCPIPHSR
jgi:hypothetical protein